MKEIKINPKQIVFNEKTRLACLSCKNFGTKATCPPYIATTEYFKKIIRAYKNGIIYYELFEADKENWENLRKESSLKIHKHILDERNKLINASHYFYLALGAGSCKLCPTCSFPCKKPSESLIPVEGTGIDLVATMKKYNIDIKFPIKDSFYRIGIFLYG
jgi:predicted metal-binding protein